MNMQHPDPESVPVRDAATVMLLRDGDDGLEVYSPPGRSAIEAALREVPRRSDRAIARSLKCDNTTVSAVRRSLGIPAGPKDRTKRERNAALVEMARTTKATYAEIGWRFGLDKTRANQIALAHGVRRSA